MLGRAFDTMTTPCKCYVRVRLFAGALALLFSASGCFRDSAPATIRVSGTITYQGKPIPRGTITFSPQDIDESRPHRPATAFIRQDGGFAMSTFARGDGVVPGTYKVWIISTSRDLEDYGADPVEWLVPAKYSRSATSGLTITIPPDAAGDVRHDFDLRD